VLNKYLWLIFISMVPVIELRGAVPVAAGMGIPPVIAVLICILSNMIPVPFILLFGRRLIGWLKTTKLFGNFATKYEARLAEKSKSIMKYAVVGLMLFVGIPAPGTGAWSGAVIATLLDMRMKYAIPAIFAGVCIAGVIMALGSYGIVGAFQIFNS